MRVWVRGCARSEVTATHTRHSSFTLKRVALTHGGWSCTRQKDSIQIFKERFVIDGVMHQGRKPQAVLHAQGSNESNDFTQKGCAVRLQTKAIPLNLLIVKKLKYQLLCEYTSAHEQSR